MDGKTLDFYNGCCCIEVIETDLVFRTAVKSICIVSPKTFHIEMVGTFTDFLIRSETNAELPVRTAFLQDRLQCTDNGSHTCFVVRAQQRGPIGSNKGPSFERRKPGEHLRIQFPAAFSQNHPPAVIIRDDLRINVLTAEGRSGIHMSNEPQGRCRFAARSGRDGTIDIAVF